MFKKVEKLKYRYDKATRELVLPMKLAKKDIFSIILKNTMTDVYRKGDRISVTSKTVDGETSTTIKFPTGADFDFVKKYGLASHPVFLFEIPDTAKNEEAAREKEIATSIKKMERIADRKEREKKVAERKATAAQKKADREQKKIDRENERLQKQAQREAERNHIGYRKANAIGKTSLSKLIRNRWESGEQGFLGATGGAMSDKIRARGVRIKRRLDPLNWVGGAAGMLPFIGGATKWAAVSGLGALFRRDPETIREFGGWARSKKDSRHTKIGPGQVRDLQSGDSSADILGKMYNFMLKDHERQKKEHELSEDFRKEQEMESERRHQKLIEEIHKLTGGPGVEQPTETKAEEEKQKTFFEKIFGGIKDTMSSFTSVVKSVFKPFLMLADVVKSVVGAFIGIGSAATSLVGGLNTLVKTVVSGAIAGVFIYMQDKFKAITTILSGVLTALSSLTGVGGLMRLLGVPGTVLAAAGVLYEFGPDILKRLSGQESDALKEKRTMVAGSSAEQDYEAYHKNLKHIQEEHTRMGLDKNAPMPDTVKRAYAKNDELKARADEEALKYQRTEIVPKLTEVLNVGGFKEISPKVNDEGYMEMMFESPFFGVRSISDILNTKNLMGNVLSGAEKIGEASFELLKKGFDAALQTDAVKQLGDKSFNTLKEIPSMIFKEIPDLEDEDEEGGVGAGQEESQNLSFNTNNTIGGQAKYADTTPISPRIRNDSIQLALARSSYVV